ncbi:MAG TPA: hypothetical protein PLY16_00025 [Candidatus Saccharibacteria bacterium]|nr:hypothetical protein [Candidatus Saccharibacteria bacterium]
MSSHQQTPTPHSKEYLDYISSKNTQPIMGRLGIKSLIAIGVGIIVVFLITITIVNLATGIQRQPLETLTARLASTETLVKDAQANLSSSELRSINSSLGIVLANINRDIKEPMQKAGVEPARLSGSVVEKESLSDTENKLEDARLNGVFDRTYAREMEYILSSTLALIKELQQTRSQQSLLTFLNATKQNLEPAQASFAEFNQ